METDFKFKRKEMVDSLILRGFLKTKKIISAFRNIKRESFVRRGDEKYSYEDHPLPIGFGATISAPHMYAIMTELLDPKKTDKILEIGTGSGYQTAILSRLVKKIYTIEIVPELVKFAESNLEKTGIKNAEVICGDGSKGYPKQKPYDKIIITCAVPEIPEGLIEQLKENGKIIVPVGDSLYQDLIVGVKKRGRLETRSYGGCAFVPLRK